MKNTRFLMAAVAVAMGTSFAVAAPTGTEPVSVKVIPAETIYVVAPHGTLHGVYVTPADAKLLGDAIRAVESDRMTNKVILTIVASNGTLTVNGMATNDVGTRIETKLKALNGGTKVYAWFDASPGSSD